MKHFEDRLNSACATDHALSAARTRGDVAFMPGWSAFAESAEAAVAVQELLVLEVDFMMRVKDHPNIVEIYDVYADKSAVYIVMEHM